MTNKMGIYGMVIDDLVFHMVFGFGEEWINDLQDVLGDFYLTLRKKIMYKGFLTDKEKKELVKHSVQTRTHTNRRIDGKDIDPKTDLFIEQLK